MMRLPLFFSSHKPLMTEASRKHVACLHPPAMQLHALRTPIEAQAGCARARIWPGSAGSYGLLRMPSVIPRLK